MDKMDSPLLLVEERDGGIFLQPATAVMVKDIPLETMQKWIADDEAEWGAISPSSREK